ncbi:MAG: hypothetical protein A4S09_17185 [Proteobacteria bacterium SG_bin7]|nr:MAG: hypothetical protein A4S09_17185 [Proteobacteria bacterium SG_bin7]
MNLSKSLFVIGAALALGGLAYANDALEQELNQLYSKQLAAEKMIQDQQAAKVENAPVVVSAPEASAAAVAPAPTITVNNQVNSLSAPMAESTPAPAAISVAPAPTVHNSPASNIEATPLAPSRADHLRKARQEVEMQTEQAIVEQLEATRLENEKKRSETLLKKISGADDPAPQSVQVVPGPAPVVESPAAAPANPEVNQLKQDVAALKEAQSKPRDENYFSFGVGMPNYQNVWNMKSDASIGFGWGFKSPSNVVFEGSLYYSLLRIERPMTAPFGFPEIDNVDQYNGVAAVKYSFFTGKIRPLVGALASYTYREYSCGQFFQCFGRSRSHALDTGLLVGGEVQVSDTFSVGVEYQWYRNLSYRTEAAIQPSFTTMYPTGRIEDQDYSIFTVRGRVTF